jgi:hypothetical protein
VPERQTGTDFQQGRARRSDVRAAFSSSIGDRLCRRSRADNVALGLRVALISVAGGRGIALLGGLFAAALRRLRYAAVLLHGLRNSVAP